MTMIRCDQRARSFVGAPPVRRSLVLGIAIALAGCVTEGKPRPRTALESTRAAVDEKSGTGGTNSAGPAPIAKPVPPDLSTSARLNFQIRPMGAVEYDGMVLPLVSPDGRFMAVERGDPPSWGTVLALPDAAPAVSTSIAVYDLASENPAGTLRALPTPEEVPRGAVLGRSCDTGGYLIEMPRPDGSRWIGRVSWMTGKTTWLVGGDRVNAHAVATTNGVLAFTRRTVGTGGATSLVLQGSDGVQTVMGSEPGAVTVGGAAGASYLLPVFGQDGSTINVLALTGDVLELLTIRVHERGKSAEFGSVLARQQMASGADVALAFQIVAPGQTTLLGRIDNIGAGGGAATEARGVVVYHPGMGRMAEFDWRRGVFVPLAAKSIAAVSSPFVEPGGYFATTPEGLTFMPFPRESSEGAPKRAPLGRMLDVPYVARATRDPARALVLIGPGTKSGTPRIEVMGVSFPPPIDTNPPASSAPSDNDRPR